MSSKFRSRLCGHHGPPERGRVQHHEPLCRRKGGHRFQPSPDHALASCWAWPPREDWQIVFVDTPGLHKPRTKLGEYMMKTAEDAKEGVDAVLAVVDGQLYRRRTTAPILAELAQMQCPKFLAVNKIDIADPEKLMPQLAKLNDLRL